jgi:hypothetical protein
MICSLNLILSKQGFLIRKESRIEQKSSHGHRAVAIGLQAIGHRGQSGELLTRVSKSRIKESKSRIKEFPFLFLFTTYGV